MALFLMFDPSSARWAGTWENNGLVSNVILTRPNHRLGSAPHRLNGDWDGVPEPARASYARTRLHIGESVDRTLTVWMDRFLDVSDQRHGEWLRVASATQDTIVLETTAAGGASFRYQGTLSPDGSTLTGAWIVEGRTGGGLNAAQSFRRID
jgi:hypothetical protein